MQIKKLYEISEHNGDNVVIQTKYELDNSYIIYSYDYYGINSRELKIYDNNDNCIFKYKHNDNGMSYYCELNTDLFANIKNIFNIKKID